MHKKSESLYLDLIKKTLSFSLWSEPPVPIKDLFIRSPIKRFLISIIAKILCRNKLQLSWKEDFSQNDRLEGYGFPGYAHSMIGFKGLNNIQYCIETVLKDKIAGDFIETGAWRGGACILMRAILAFYKITDRKVFVADSFEGLPKPNVDLYPNDKGDKLYVHKYLVVSKEEVKDNFAKYNLLDDQVIFLKGWFKDTLPSAPIGQLAVLRIDGDMYGSTMESLEYLYPKLSKGGFCIIDDYSLKGCQIAVDEYRVKYQINSEIKKVDWTRIYWRKE